MLIFATIAINVAGVAIWSAVYGANGFKEVGKLIRGQAAFIPPENSGDNEVDPRAEDYYGDDSDLPPTSPRRAKRPGPYDPDFGVHPDDFYQ